MSSALYDCPAPAKLNLFLHVLGRRPDGYHQLQTAFQLLDHSDTLDFSLRSDSLIRRGNALPGVPPESDLTVRAARLLQQATGSHLGADITVHKQLPMGGGLGGGSSDAATTLIVLNHLWKTALSRQQLMSLGKQLGADVPFFLFGNNAFAEGIGEVLTPISTPPRWFVVLEPGISIPTATIFSDPELTRNTKAVRITDFPDAGNYFSSGFGKNDLEVVAAKRFSPVAESLKWLRKHGNQDARMTGSGACIFCSFLHEEQADEVLDQVPSQWTGWKARALKEHPLAHLTSW